MEILSDQTPDMLAMPRFDDGAIDMQELLRRLAEQVVNAVMDAEADQPCKSGGHPGGGTTWPCPEIIEAALREMAAEGSGFDPQACSLTKANREARPDCA